MSRGVKKGGAMPGSASGTASGLGLGLGAGVADWRSGVEMLGMCAWGSFFLWLLFGAGAAAGVSALDAIGSFLLWLRLPALVRPEPGDAPCGLETPGVPACGCWEEVALEVDGREARAS